VVAQGLKNPGGRENRRASPDHNQSSAAVGGQFSGKTDKTAVPKPSAENLLKYESFNNQ
jgi:hypothetical protein